MPRPAKCRQVCCMPQSTVFLPKGKAFSENTSIIMTVDEYEALRLIDYEGFTQEECAVYMKIARTTVQQIYDKARKKLSAVLVEGKSLVISGGSFRLCNGQEPHCSCGGCKKHSVKK